LSSARRTKNRGAAAPPPPSRSRARPRPPPLDAPAPEGSAPEIRFEFTPAGRETISAISDEVVGAACEIAARTPEMSAPEISLDEAPAGRDTVAAIAREAATHAATAVRPRLTTLDYSSRPTANEPGSEAIGPSGNALEISELVTFVVRGGDLAPLSTEEGRLRFVAERLMQRLPVESLEQVLRVDVAPWTARGTLIVRVWCRLDG
jgi:hypothetical protein